MSYDLSIIIPARNEEFLSLTVEGLLKNKRGNTQIVIGLDGEWANPPIEDNKDVTIIYYGKSIGQRAMGNRCAAISNAKWILKLDAHCIVDEGFDEKIIDGVEDNWTVVPILYNLHAFDRVCPKCRYRLYQGPEPMSCPECGITMKREMVWRPRFSRKSEFYRFDTTLHFQYHGERKSQVEKNNMFPETMSLQGSCFMLTKKRYFDLNINDETWGSWGNQATEVACKTWLSGGSVRVNRKTWYSHLFRTQGGSFGFPYPQSGNQVEHARQMSRDLFMNNKWDKQIYPLSWLIEKFKPMDGWHRAGKKEPYDKKTADEVYRKGEEFYRQRGRVTKGIIYYTDNRVPIKIGYAARKTIKQANLPIVSCSLKKMDFGENIVLPLERGYVAYHKQILAALETSMADIIFFCEHDVLYHKSHFDFTPSKKDVYYYNTNFWRVRLEDGHAVHYDTEQVNMICAYRELLLKHYREKVRRIEESGFTMKMGFEPGCNPRKERIDNFKAERWQSEYPNIDIRYGGNLTRSRWSQEEFRNKRSCKGWKECEAKDIQGWDFKEKII